MRTNRELESEGLRLHADHVLRVQTRMAEVLSDIARRMVVHDQSKYSDIELPLIVGKATLNAVPYGTDEYKVALGKVEDSLVGHYFNNSHHPEHFADDGIGAMSLLDLLEMLCDWKAAGEQNGGSIKESLRINVERYNISPELTKVLRRTIQDLGW